jgi:diadenosine tetraphosphate (Ap4A) HIT family hydrolase
MATRSLKMHRAYKRYLRDVQPNNECQFCLIDKDFPQHIRETKSFKIIHNTFPYSSWDFMHTDDHLLIIPKKHTDKLADLNSQEALEFMNIIGSYESRGYNIYARAPQTAVKSVVHQHTHLIKPTPNKKPHRFVLFVKRPYLRLVR